MKYVSENARALLETITSEHALQAERVAGGWIEPHQMMGYLIERLNTLSMRNEALRAFLSSQAPVPPAEDESPDVPWAEDPRDARQHEVYNRGGTSEATERLNDPDWIAPWPLPGERIA